MGLLATVLGWVLPILTALPSLITGAETLWSHTPKSGPQKWISVEQSVSGTIELAANEIAKLAPPGTDAQTISDAIAVFTKAVNDAFVALMNALKILPTSQTKAS
jgi:hypothetical protein